MRANAKPAKLDDLFMKYIVVSHKKQTNVQNSIYAATGSISESF